MIKKTEYKQQWYHHKTDNFGGRIVVGMQFFNHKHWNANNTLVYVYYSDVPHWDFTKLNSKYVKHESMDTGCYGTD